MLEILFERFESPDVINARLAVRIPYKIVLRPEKQAAANPRTAQQELHITARVRKEQRPVRVLEERARHESVPRVADERELEVLAPDCVIEPWPDCGNREVAVPDARNLRNRQAFVHTPIGLFQVGRAQVRPKRGPYRLGTGFRDREKNEFVAVRQNHSA